MTILNASEDVEKLDLSYTAGNVNEHNQSRKDCDNFFKKVNIHLSYNPAITLLGIYPKEKKTYVHSKTHT